MVKKWIVAVCMAGVLLVGCAKQLPIQDTPITTEQEEQQPAQVEEEIMPEVELVQFELPKAGEEIAVMTTNKGTIKIQFFPEYAPKAVENFKTHSKNGYYNGLSFHRIIPDFMIQGGDPSGDGTGGESIWGEPFEDEFHVNVLNYRGALSMANSGPSTNGSQFFIVQNPKAGPEMIEQMKAGGYPEKILDKYTEVGGTPWLDFRHTVFGHVFEGMDIVDQITAMELDENDKPKQPVLIEKMEIVEYK